jgi:hypothetical protein
MPETFRVRVLREWIGGGPLDPETYWGTAEETVTLIDRLLDAEQGFPSLTPIALIQVDTFENGHMTGERVATVYPRS